MATQEVMICKNCGRDNFDIGEGAIFCMECNAKVGQLEAGKPVYDMEMVECQMVMIPEILDPKVAMSAWDLQAKVNELTGEVRRLEAEVYRLQAKK